MSYSTPNGHTRKAGSSRYMATLFAVAFLLSASWMFAQNRTGHIFDFDLYQRAELANFDDFGFGDELPSSVSMREFAPYPGDQGNFGTCVGWSSAYCALTTQFAIAYNIGNRSIITATAYCPYFLYSQIKFEEDEYCQDGAYIYNALSSFRLNGAKRYLYQPSSCGTSVQAGQLEGSKNFRIESFKRLYEYPEGFGWSLEEFFNTDIDKVSNTKAALAENKVVVFGMLLPPSFGYFDPSMPYNATADEIANAANLSLGGHAMAIIGYDDAKQAFEVQNSWGQGWADGGYFWLSYEAFNKWTQEAFVFDLFDNIGSGQGCVTGDCDNGYGRYVYSGGDIYEGDFVNGSKHGSGIYIWTNGNAYAGGWKEGSRHGFAIFTLANGAEFNTMWNEDELISDQSEYVETDFGSGCVSGDCHNGYGRWVLAGVSYEGNFKNGLRHGFGTMIDSDGTKLIGEWQNNELHGIGKLEMREGVTVVANFKDGLRDGFGLTYTMGGYWIGNYLEGYAVSSGPASRGANTTPTIGISNKMARPANRDNNQTGCISGDCENGVGKFRYNDGSTYEGTFKDGKRSHFGVYRFTNGDIYTGSWLNGTKDGIGRYNFASGTYFIGEYRKGKPDGYGYEVGTDYYGGGIWEFGKYQPGKTLLGFGEGEAEDFSDQIQNIGDNFRGPGEKEMMDKIRNLKLQ